MAETIRPSCSCGFCQHAGRWFKRVDAENPEPTPIPQTWCYCPRCGDLLGDGTTTPPAMAEQRRDAEAMRILRETWDGFRWKIDVYGNEGNFFAGWHDSRGQRHQTKQFRFLTDAIFAAVEGIERQRAEAEADTGGQTDGRTNAASL